MGRKKIIRYSLAISILLIVSDLAFAKTKILFLGDSITEGVGVDHNKSYPALVEIELKKNPSFDIAIVNAGISGSTTASALKRLKWQLKGHPDIILICLGANDGLRGQNLDESKLNLSKTIELAQKNHLKVILAGMKIPPNYGQDYSKRFEKMFEDLAFKYKIIFIPFILQGVAADPKLNLPDGIHPNEKGHEIVAKTVLPYILEALK